jgi:ribosomal protein S6--L-glutamate ligase
LEEAELVVVRGRSVAVLATVLQAERLGIPTINARAAIAAVHNKLEMAVALEVAGVPTPPTWIGPPHELARRVPGSAYPLMLKPIFGDNAHGLRLVAGAAELAVLKWPEPVALAQGYLATDGRDLKLYGIGDRLFAVRKPSPFCPGPLAVGREVQPVSLTPELVRLGRRCGRLFGLELFGVDCLETEEGVVVVEVNEFPNYTGVPGAAEALADHVLARLAAGAS